MNYITPDLVRSPKHSVGTIVVLHDGGEWREAGGEWTGWSAAIVEWCDEERVALRWNGTKEVPVGNPQSRGLPTWFIVPYPLEDVIREALKLAPRKAAA